MTKTASTGDFTEGLSGIGGNRGERRTGKEGCAMDRLKLYPSDSDSNLSDILPRTDGSRSSLNIADWNSTMACKCPLWVAVAALVGLVVAVIVLIAVPVARNQILHRDRSYVVMVDAGSSSSKIYVYSWRSGASSEETPKDIRQEFFARTKGRGISSFASTPEKATTEIVKLIKTNVIDPKPDGSPALLSEKQRARTPIYMGATAGMRLLEARDPKVFKELLTRVREDFSKLGFQIKNVTRQIRVITGDEEALAGWISTNLLSDTLRKASKDPKVPQSGTLGALDMGGASAQVSFVTKAPVGLEVTKVTLYDHDLSVYQHSFLCFGKGTARDQLLAALWRENGQPKTGTKAIKNPCSHPGLKEQVKASDFLVKPCFIAKPGVPTPSGEVVFTFEGTGDYKSCDDITSKLFLTKKCTHSRCSFDNIFQPELPPGKFVAFSSYYFAMSFFNVTKEKMSRKDYRNVLKDYCKRPWSSVAKQYSIPSAFLRGYCFDGIYIDRILSTIGFNDDRWRDIQFTGKIGKRKMSWPLGYLLKERSNIPPGVATYRVSEPAYKGVVAVFVLVLLGCIALLVVFLFLRRCGPRYTPAADADVVA